MKGLILIIEDEPDLVSTLAYNLEHDGHSTRRALTGATGLEQAWCAPIPDLILLDLMLPDMPGTEVCRELRRNPKTSRVPVVMLTAKGEEVDRVVGFEVGADDYMVKPFSVRELMLRIRAVLRRTQVTVVPQPASVAGRIRVDLDSHRVWVNDDEVVLTALEFRLLTTFMERKGRVQTRDTLLNDVWGIEADITTRTVDTHVKRLRQKLGSAGDYIETLRGVGYRFVSPTDEGLG